MGQPLTPEVTAFLNEEVFAHIATLMKDGSPQVTPVWVWTDGTDILINASETSQKVRNLRRDSRVAIRIGASRPGPKDPEVLVELVSRLFDGRLEPLHSAANRREPRQRLLEHASRLILFIRQLL